MDNISILIEVEYPEWSDKNHEHTGNCEIITRET